MTMRWKAGGWVLALLAALALALWRPWLGAGADSGLVSGNGRIEATEIAVAAKYAGRLQTLLVREGDFVEAGQPLARLQSDSLQAQHDEARARLQQAEQAIQTARVQVAQAESGHQAALAVVADIEALGRKGLAVRADSADPEQVAELFSAVDRSFGRIDVLVNNAGVLAKQSRMEDLSFERMQRIFAVNALGPILCAQQAVKRMAYRHGGTGGAVINVSSASARLGASSVVSPALYNTAFGLIVAIPALMFWRYFRSLVDNQLLSMEVACEQFARHLNHLRF